MTWPVVSDGFVDDCSPFSLLAFSVRHLLDDWKLLMRSAMITELCFGQLCGTSPSVKIGAASENTGR